MSYFTRAQSLLERGQAMRAFNQLALGLRRDPRNEQALNLLVDVYIREIQSPGLERDLLRVLNVVPEGLDIYEMVRASLEQSGDERRVKSLLQTREREGLLEAPAPAPADTVQTPTPASGEQAHFERPPVAISSPEPVPSATSSSDRAHAIPPGAVDMRSYGRDDARGEATRDAASYHGTAPSRAYDDEEGHQHASQVGAAAAMDDSSVPSPPTPTVDDPFFDEMRATTGVFSSIDQYLDGQHEALAQELRERSKRRMLIVGAVIIVLIFLVIFAIPSADKKPTKEGPGTSTTVEQSDTVPIEQPLPPTSDAPK